MENNVKVDNVDMQFPWAKNPSSVKRLMRKVLSPRARIWKNFTHGFDWVDGSSVPSSENSLYPFLIGTIDEHGKKVMYGGGNTLQEASNDVFIRIMNTNKEKNNDNTNQ